MSHNHPVLFVAGTVSAFRLGQRADDPLPGRTSVHPTFVNVPDDHVVVAGTGSTADLRAAALLLDEWGLALCAEPLTAGDVALLGAGCEQCMVNGVEQRLALDAYDAADDDVPVIVPGSRI